YTRTLYSSILDLSRSYQHKQLGATSALYDEINEALENTPKLFPTAAKVACQGVEGAYSQSAAQKLFRSPDIHYYGSFEDVFRAVESGACRYGVLPLENSTAGSVNKVYDLMLSHQFYIVRSARIRISHNLYMKPGASIEDVREVISHEQALSQSAEYLRSLGNIKITPVANTAMAAQMVRDSDRTDLAALASSACGSLYGLSCLASAVQDKGANYTRFVCISKELELYPGSEHTSLMMVISQKPGSLYRILSSLNASGVNITKLESRPIPDRDFEARFYLDVDLSIYDPEFARTFAALERECEELRYLGTYNEIF
ncbi:MAG: bifunctional chorismate mutase/prephenate dehydratase, partial [Clostridia bacterium]|nr:bifunctional chorismate mutase/prephenate dehydratase [Clostridia bacterium]